MGWFMRISLDRYFVVVVVLFTSLLIIVSTGCSGLSASNRVVDATDLRSKPSRSINVSITPSSVSLQEGTTQQFTATVSGTNNTAVTWSASGGSISSSGLYTAPTTAGTYSVIATSVANNTKTAASSVTVLSASQAQSSYLLSANPSLLSFGSVLVGSTVNQTLTLSNTGNADVTISAGTASGTGYALTGLSYPFTIAAGARMGINISFTPQASGTIGGSVSFVSNAINSPTTASLTGSGATPVVHSVDLNWNPSSSSVVGYNVYRGSSSGGPFSKLNTSVQPATTFIDANVLSGSLYYYYVTAVDSSGNESAASNEASALIPTP